MTTPRSIEGIHSLGLSQSVDVSSVAVRKHGKTQQLVNRSSSDLQQTYKRVKRSASIKSEFAVWRNTYRLENTKRKTRTTYQSTRAATSCNGRKKHTRAAPRNKRRNDASTPAPVGLSTRASR